MKKIKSILITVFMLSIISCNAQIKNTKTENIKIFGNCEMCKNNIENAGNQRKEAQIEWNKDTKIATISYDSLKTSKNDILKRIALAGYDNELFLAPDDTYATLPGCCQYERAKKEVDPKEMTEMKMAENQSEPIKSDTIETPKTKTETAKIDYLKLVFDNYFEVKNALVQSDANLASNKATELSKSLDNVNMNDLEMDVHMVWMKVMKDLKVDANKMSESKDIELQRTFFISISKNIYSLLKLTKYETPVYYQFCPMANDGKGANWLSTESNIKNPFYGAQMLGCGKTVETIQK